MATLIDNRKNGKVSDMLELRIASITRQLLLDRVYGGIMSEEFYNGFAEYYHHHQLAAGRDDILSETS